MATNPTPKMPTVNARTGKKAIGDFAQHGKGKAAGEMS
jgi:hypothetical protein